MSMAYAVSERSYDSRLKVGSIIVSEDNTQLLSLGYNGNYSGGPNEPESTEPGQSGFLHSEVNCLIKCDFNFHKKKVMYITHSPCRQCSKAIINGRISKVIYDIQYRDTSGIELLKSSDILIFSLKEAENIIQ